MDTSFRKVEVLKNKAWETVKMKDLTIGDVFRLFDVDENGDIADDAIESGLIKYKATGSPYINESNVWTINVMQYLKIK